MKSCFTILAAALVLPIVSASAAAQSAQTQPMQQTGSMPMKSAGAKPAMQRSPRQAEGVGVVEAIDLPQGTVTLKHQPIESIHWPAMTMTFKIANQAVLQGVKVGEHVRFGLHPAGMKSTVTWIKPAAR